jgi:hypothetical protein
VIGAFWSIPLYLMLYGSCALFTWRSRSSGKNLWRMFSYTDLKTGLLFSCKVRIFCIVHHVRTNSRPTRFPYQREPWAIRPGCKVIHPPSCSAEVKNASTSTSTRPLRLHGAAHGPRHLYFYLHFPWDASVETAVTASAT